MLFRSFHPPDCRSRHAGHHRGGRRPYVVRLQKWKRFDLKSPIADNNRGVAYGATGDNDHAIADYSDAIRLNPKVAGAYANRGRAYRAKGDNDHAIADYTKAIKLDPKLANAYDNRGRAYRAKGENDRATRDFKEAIRLDPKLAPALKALAVEL